MCQSVRKTNTVFVEVPNRIKEIITNHLDEYQTFIINSSYTQTYNIKYTKSVLCYFVDHHEVIIIDNEFSEMFSTAFVKIQNLPQVFKGTLEMYQHIVHLLYQQLKWNYEEQGLVIAKFRRDIFDKIAQLSIDSIRQSI